MKPLRARMRAPENLTAVFLAVAGVSVFALVWLGVGIIRQDRALEAQRLADRREGAADRLVAALERTLAVEEGLLGVAPLEPPAGLDRNGAFLLVADHAGLQTWPDRALLYSPSTPPLREASADLYRAAEALEHTNRDYERAIALLRDLTSSRDPAVKAGAQLRVARNLRKAGRADAALAVYGELAKVADVGLSGVPAGLVASRARCAQLEELGRADQLRVEALVISEGLRDGRWQLDRAAWHYYAAQAGRWLGKAPEDDGRRRALAEGADWIWQRWRAGQAVEPRSSGRRALERERLPVTVLWRASNERLAAFVAGAEFQRQHWFEPAVGSLDRPGIAIALLDERDQVLHGTAPLPGAPETRRLAMATGLPWTIVATSTNLDADLRGFAQRRTLIIVGLGALGLLVVAASYLIGRSVSRELAAARLQSDFVAAVSHEFRTPLTSLAQFTEILAEQENAPVDKRRVFHEAQARATRRLSRLVESLLDFGRMEAGARPYRLQPLDAADLVESVVRDFRQEVAGPDLSIEYTRRADGTFVNADRDALAQAIWNLLDNAVKYSGDSRIVQVEVETSGEVAIRVRDNGFGIDASEQKLIFRKFARGAAAREHDVKGTGIGLAMVKHIVDAHGGRITVDSEPGRGSVFSIVLPGIRNQESGVGNQRRAMASIPES